MSCSLFFLSPHLPPRRRRHCRPIVMRMDFLAKHTYPPPLLASALLLLLFLSRDASVVVFRPPRWRRTPNRRGLNAVSAKKRRESAISESKQKERGRQKGNLRKREREKRRLIYQIATHNCLIERVLPSKFRTWRARLRRRRKRWDSSDA